jgi:hypothetical protein
VTPKLKLDTGNSANLQLPLKHTIVVVDEILEYCIVVNQIADNSIHILALRSNSFFFQLTSYTLSYRFMFSLFFYL